MKLTSPKTNANSSNDHRSKPLDLTTVKTTRETTPRTRERIFGLTEAPTYYPTTEEFKDPLKYINKIQLEAEQYGIIKIVPPKDYKPDFCLDTEVFRFRTRIQKLNSMEGQTRASLNYWDQLQNYHRSQGKPIYRIPHVDKRPIDLYKLKKVVMQKGGYCKVSNEKSWRAVGESMGYIAGSCHAMSNSLEKAYTRLILPYEDWLEKHKDKSNPFPDDSGDDDSDGDDTEDTEDSEDTNDDEMSDGSVSSDDADQVCEICHIDNNAAELLLCDDCDRGYHMKCLTPPLASVPSAEWYCMKCLTDAGKDYGFEDGDEYSLSGFQNFCNKFKTDWFSEGTPVKSPFEISEEDCEDEFWRLVDDPHETCEVEYGADLHSTRHGSASASMERGPNGIEGYDAWNPYILPILPDSLFTHIKNDISGMMVPWVYIGMCFSAFCWHNEDHYTYSVNYMHWGETKTWYGVPGTDTAKFEDTMKKAVPELFEQQPNLLFQLVTMLSPGRLLKEKVRVYAVDQRPGEFVVTFPKAYHSGFNHGFNLCEAVNFAPADWLPLGLECAKRYKEYRRQPCFSHDEMLVNVTKLDLKQENAMAIKNALLEMQLRELNERRKFKKQHPQVKHLPLSESCDFSSASQNDQQHQCLFCHCYTFLSYVTCSCTEKVACLDHLNELCECRESKKKLILRFTAKEIQQLVGKATQMVKETSDWDILARTMLSGNTMPSTNSLKQLLMEADRKGIPAAETMDLRTHLDQIQNWELETAQLLHTMNPKRKRSDTHLEANHTVDGCDNESPYNGKRHLLSRNLLQQSYTMAFDSPYIDQLRIAVEKLDSLQQQAKAMSSTQIPPEKDLQTMVDLGYSMDADIEETNGLNTTLLQQNWINTLEPEAMQLPLDIDTITTLVKQARQHNIPEDNPKLENALAKLHQGNNWLKRARHLLTLDGCGRSIITLDGLDDLLNVDSDVPTLREMYQELQSLRSILHSATSIFNRNMMQCLLPDLLHRPTANYIRELQAQAADIPFIAIQNESHFFDYEMARIDNWTIKAKSLLVTNRNGLNKSRSLEMLIDDIYDETDHILSLHWKQKTPQHKQAVGRRRLQNHCICQQPESGFMIKCDVCDDWYHGRCVRESRKNFDFNNDYTCPVCDPSNDIYGLVKRPKMDDFCDLMDDAKDLKMVPEDYLALRKILMKIKRYREEVVNFCRSKPVLDANDIGKIKGYLKELLGLPIVLEDETDFLRKKVYDITTQKQQQQPLQQLNHHSQHTHQNQHLHQHQHEQQQQKRHYTLGEDGKLDPDNQYQGHHHITNNDHDEPHQCPLETPSTPTPLPSSSSSSSSASASSTTTSRRPVINLILNPPKSPNMVGGNNNTTNHHSHLDNNKRKSDAMEDYSANWNKKIRSNSISHSQNSNYSTSPTENPVLHHLPNSLFDSPSM